MSTYSPILRVEEIVTGDQAGAWGTTTNKNFQYIFENAIAGYQAISVNSTSHVLTYTYGPDTTPSLDQSVYAILKLNTGTVAANFSVYAPPVSKTYIIYNNTSYTATVYNSSVIGNTTAAGLGISIPAGLTSFIWSDGTNFYSVITGSSGNLNVSGNLTVGGTTTLTGLLTANGGATSTTITATTQFVGPGTGLTGTAASLTAGNATLAASATNIAGGGAKQMPFQSAVGTTSFVSAPTAAYQFLGFDGTNIVWGTPAAAGGAVVENGQTITSNYTMTTGYNGESVGPITVAAGVSITIPTGSRWAVF